MGVDEERKRALRATTLAVRRQLSPRRRAEASEGIVAHLEGLPELRRAEAVLLYVALAEEPDLAPLATSLRSRGVTTLLPRVRGEHLEVVAAAEPHRLAPGFRGILEPPGPAQDPDAIDVVLVPGVAFDLRGGRLGQGGGHYDRLLPRLHERALRVGVAFACQIVPAVVREPHDEPIDVLVTEHALHRTGARADPDRGA